ncbi:hypothetical protein DPMN_016776 [Dreissena polymorpha]|uniref:Uncharacterized protein n=1 Tax=Dreissena polymorpha TaxID=45954 RepID=A0A9D4NAA8_DREPO|nr:hypothetical protein DPMN_016679 [Dreissena polymorpha]KAH3892653.1 hypothetical protein DPMN_016776 [Dreissena polymorpha]
MTQLDPEMKILLKVRYRISTKTQMRRASKEILIARKCRQRLRLSHSTQLIIL